MLDGMVEPFFLVREMGQVNAETDRVNIRRENT